MYVGLLNSDTSSYNAEMFDPFFNTVPIILFYFWWQFAVDWPYMSILRTTYHSNSDKAFIKSLVVDSYAILVHHLLPSAWVSSIYVLLFVLHGAL